MRRTTFASKVHVPALSKVEVRCYDQSFFKLKVQPHGFTRNLDM